MDKLLLALGHDTTNKVNALARAIELIKSEYLVQENKDNKEFMILLDHMKSTLLGLQIVLDKYNLDRKSVSQESQ